jgi:hypothetical protein
VIVFSGFLLIHYFIIFERENYCYFFLLIHTTIFGSLSFVWLIICGYSFNTDIEFVYSNLLSYLIPVCLWGSIIVIHFIIFKYIMKKRDSKSFNNDITEEKVTNN